jgi:hypothetical protein
MAVNRVVSRPAVNRVVSRPAATTAMTI